MIQSKEELERWYSTSDPWDYDVHPDDEKRRDMLLSELPDRPYTDVLDIGCGNAFITRNLPGCNVLGMDISEAAITYARQFQDDRRKFISGSIFNLNHLLPGRTFDLVVITGVLYPQYIGKAHNLIYLLIDSVLAKDGILVTVHIDEWYRARFPYLMMTSHFYDYREYLHRLEVYVK